MNTMDIKTLAADADRIIGGLPDHTTRGPIQVERDGVPEAIIIRAQAWAPRLHHFDFAPDGRIVCTPCSGSGEPWHRPVGAHLGDAVERANEHWREKHAGPRR